MSSDNEVQWQPPTAESLYKHFEDEQKSSPYEYSEESNFHYFYNTKVGEHGEQVEILPGLFGKIDNIDMDHGMAPGSIVWINNGVFMTWYLRRLQNQLDTLTSISQFLGGGEQE